MYWCWRVSIVHEGFDSHRLLVTGYQVVRLESRLGPFFKSFFFRFFFTRNNWQFHVDFLGFVECHSSRVRLNFYSDFSLIQNPLQQTNSRTQNNGKKWDVLEWPSTGSSPFMIASQLLSVAHSPDSIITTTCFYHYIKCFKHKLTEFLR